MSIAPEADNAQQAAAFHGLATNRAYPPDERLRLALKALDLYEAEVEQLRVIVEAAKDWYAVWHETDVEHLDGAELALIAAVQAWRAGGGS